MANGNGAEGAGLAATLEENREAQVRVTQDGSVANPSSDDDDDDDAYVRWDQSWPAAKGPAAVEIVKALGSVRDQKARAEAHFNLLTADDRNLLVFNGDNHPTAYMLLKPSELKVRIVYSLGVPMDIMTALNPNAVSHFSALMLDLKGGSAYPAAMAFPVSATEKTEMTVASAEMLAAKSAQFPSEWPVWSRAEVRNNPRREVVEIMQMAPVPFFTVMDGLDHDLDILEVHERLSSLTDAATKPYLKHALAMLRAGMAKYNAAEHKPHLEAGVFAQAQSDRLYQWAEGKFRAICPTFVTPGNGGQENSNDEFKRLMELFLLNQTNRQAAPAGGASTAPAAAPGPKTWAEKLNISEVDLDTFMLLCGLKIGQEEDQLPAWLEKIKQKNTSAGAKDRICVDALGHKIYPTHSPPALKTTLQMMQNQNWMGGEATATYANAMKGLSPFLCTPMSEEAISSWNEMEDALAKAKATSVDELKAQKRKITVPTNFEGLLKVLKAYVNLLHACFGGRCPLALELRKTVSALEKYSDGAQNQMQKPTIAAVLWIILLQTKHFTLGKMNFGVHTVVLPEFTVMQNSIVSKNPSIAHAEVPQALLTVSGDKRQTSGAGGDPDKDPSPKKPKGATPEGGGGGGGGNGGGGGGGGGGNKFTAATVQVHKLVQSKLTGILQVAKANRVNVSLLCQACDTTPQAVLPQHMCLTAAVYGVCNIRRCRRKHEPITDEQADNILKHFEPIINDPSKIPTSGKRY